MKTYPLHPFKNCCATSICSSFYNLVLSFLLMLGFHSILPAQSDICNGDYFIFTAADAQSLVGCRVIQGDLYIESNPDMINTNHPGFQGIEEITGRLQLAFNGALEDVTFSNLKKITEFSVFDNYTEFSFYFPELERVDFVEMLFNTNMKRIEMPKLDTVGFFDLFDNQSLETIVLNEQTKFDAVSLFNNTSLADCCIFSNAAKQGRWSGFGNETGCNSVTEIIDSCSPEQTFRLVDQHGVEYNQATFRILETGDKLPQNGTITLDPGTYTVQVFPTINDKVQGVDLYRDIPNVEVNNTTTLLEFTWAKANFSLRLNDQHGQEIPNSQFNNRSPIGASYFTILTSGSISLPVTDYPGTGGNFKDGYIIRSFPGIAGKVQGSELSRPEGAIPLPLAGHISPVTLVWKTATLELLLNDQYGDPIPQTQWSNRSPIGASFFTVGPGDPMPVLPITDGAGIGGNMAGGYPFRVFPGVNNTLQGNRLYRNVGSIPLQEGGTSFALEWTTYTAGLHLVNINALPHEEEVCTATIRLPASSGSILSGESVILPVNDADAYPGEMGGTELDAYIFSYRLTDSDPYIGPFTLTLSEVGPGDFAFTPTSLGSTDYALRLEAPPVVLDCPVTAIDLGVAEEVIMDGADLGTLGFSASGGCGGPTLSISPSVFQIGDTPAEIVATDGVGHTSSPCSVTVTVRAPCSVGFTNRTVMNVYTDSIRYQWDDIGATECQIFVRRISGRPQSPIQRPGVKLYTVRARESYSFSTAFYYIVNNAYHIPYGEYKWRVKCDCGDPYGDTGLSDYQFYTFTPGIGDLGSARQSAVTGTTIPSSQPRADLHGYFLFPNPVKDQLTIRYEGEDLGPQLLRLIDLTGRTVQAQEVEAGQWEVQLPVKGLPAGLYILNAESNLGKRQFKVIVGADSGVRDD